jgi:putative DNA primase/helicase
MSNVVPVFNSPSLTAIPLALRETNSWLVWKYVKAAVAGKKPRKVPYYTTGSAREGEQSDDEPFASFNDAVDVATRGRYAGVGLAMRRKNGIVALDFDDCVVDGVVDPRVMAVIEGTYAEFSPSGNGVRAFFLGDLSDGKDTAVEPKVEFFCGSGYVTVTGAMLPDCEMWGWTEPAELTPAVISLHMARIGAGPADDDWLASLSPKVGLTLERARVLLTRIDPECSREEWLDVLMALHAEFDGSDAALDLADEWSSKAENYAGRKDVEGRWRSFKRGGLNGKVLLRRAKDESAHQKYEALEEWREQVRLVEDEFELREKLCPKIAADDRLDDVERESLAHVLQRRLQGLGTKLTISFCRKLISPPEARVPTVKTKRPLTEFGNAERMLDRFGESLMYVPETDVWYCWTGVYWRRTTSVEIEFYAKETIKGLLNEAEEHDSNAAEFFEFCRHSQQAKMVRSMITLAASDPRVMVPAAELDKHVGLLGVQNGVVDLKTGRLMEPDPMYRITRVASCDYRPGARCELFMKVLSDVFSGDAEMVEFFLRVLGYTLIGDPVQDFMVIAYGNGSNGKSTVFGAVRKVLGTYAKSADAGSFVSKGDGGGSAGGPREDLVRLQGTRFVYVNEPDENGELREGAVKSMSGGDAITARGVHAKMSVEFEPTWVAFMPTNHKPIVKGSDNGIWRRLVMLPFLRNFDSDPEVKKDEKLAEKLGAESEGVLAVLVDAAGRYLRDGLSQPAVVKKAREDYRSQMDILSEWLEERCEFSPEYQESVKSLWQSWEGFAKERGILQYVRSSIALGRRLDQRFPRAKQPGGDRMRQGLRLKVMQGLEGDNSEAFFD